MSPTKEKETFDYVVREKVEVTISKDEKAYVEISANDKAEKLIRKLEMQHDIKDKRKDKIN